MNNETKRILQLLQSADREMVILGVIMAIKKGRIWCKENIPCYGISRAGNFFREEDTLKSNIKESVQIKGNGIGVLIINGVDFRDLTDFPFPIDEFEEI